MARFSAPGATARECPSSAANARASWLGLTEEACGHEINVVVLLLVRSGLYIANSFDPATGDLWIRHDTQLTPTPIVTAYLYGEVE